MQEKTAFFFNYKIIMRLSFLLGNLNRYETNLFAYCKKYWSWNHVDAAGFPDFRSTLHAQQSGKKNVKLIINTISSTFRVSINIRVLRAIFRVPRLSADQREIQKKDEYRFSISYKEQLRKEELTRECKWGWGCTGSWTAFLRWTWIEIVSWENISIRPLLSKNNNMLASRKVLTCPKVSD